MPTPSLRSHRPVLVGLLVLLLASLVPAGAAADDDWSFSWKNGFRATNDEAGHALKFGGRTQADYQFADSDNFAFEDGFEFRRARLFFSGKIYDKVHFKAQYDFAGDNEVKDLWIGFDVGSAGRLQFGHFKEHFSLEEITSSKYLTFLERSLPVLAFTPVRNSGVALEGHRGDRVNWGVGAYYDADGFGESTNEDDRNVTARIGLRPVWENDGERMVHLGLSLTSQDRAQSLRYRVRPENHQGGRVADTGTFAADGARLFAAELATVQGPFWASAEYFGADADAPLAGDPSFDGWYVQAGYFLTGEHRAFKTSTASFDRLKPEASFGGGQSGEGRGAWELKARVSSVDLTDGAVVGGEVDNLSLGVNWYVNPATRVMLDWVDADVEGAGDASFVLMRFQVDF